MSLYFLLALLPQLLPDTWFDGKLQTADKLQISSGHDSLSRLPVNLESWINIC